MVAWMSRKEILGINCGSQKVSLESAFTKTCMAVQTQGSATTAFRTGSWINGGERRHSIPVCGYWMKFKNPFYDKLDIFFPCQGRIGQGELLRHLWPAKNVIFRFWKRIVELWYFSQVGPPCDPLVLKKLNPALDKLGGWVPEFPEGRVVMSPDMHWLLDSLRLIGSQEKGC